MLYLIALLPVAMLVSSIYRYWVCIRNLGYFNEVVRRAPNWLPQDCAALAAAGFALYYAAMGWWGFTIPMINEEPLPTWANTLMVMAASAGSIGLAYYNAGLRFERPSWVGMRESALRSVAALRIIDAVELGRLLEIAREHNARIVSTGGCTYEGKAREVRK